ncbi:AAA family ATPase [Saccharopolyspora taberi]|uniref:AAA family ATPase n=1 Tax=Saccharopolyspora taberi TaxID=60895 RepID=A0ABN3VPN8_9PSEU
MAKVITNANQKGGVGKSTTTINLARAAAVQGKRVLVVDFDAQGNATSAIVRDPLERDEMGEIVQITVADAIMPRATVTLEEVVVPSIWDGIDLVPSGTPLAAVEEMIIPAQAREFKLANVLKPLLPNYDLVLIDSPPSLGQLTVNALTASEQVLVVTQPQQWSADGMAELAKTVTNVQTYFNQKLTYVGVLVNMWQGTTEERATKRNKQVLADIEEYFVEAPLLRPFIPFRTHIGEAVDEGIGLDQWKTVPMRMIAEDYATHVNTIMAG